MRVAFTGDLGLTARLLPDPAARISPGVSRILRSCDLSVANLELPVRPREAVTAPYSHPSLFGLPAAWPVVGAAGFRALCISSNHCMDSGRKGIAFTRYLASRDGIAVFGAGLDEEGARAPAILEVQGRRLGMLGYCKKGPFTASGTRAGAALLSESNLRTDIPALKRRCDLVAVSLHAGMEFVEDVHPAVARFARTAVECGADCVVCHHPHVVQPVETILGKPVFYSLGNFLFDNRAGASPCDRAWRLRHRGLVAVVTFGPGADPTFELVQTSYDPDGLRVELSGGLELPASGAPGSAEQADRAGLRAIASREASTVARLTRLHGAAFLCSVLFDLRPRHARMLWNALLGRRGGS